MKIFLKHIIETSASCAKLICIKKKENMDYPLDKLRVLEQKLTLGSGDNKDFWNQVVLPEIESINTSVSSSYKAIINAIETDTTEGNTISKKINDLKNTIGIVFTTLHRLSKKYEEMTGNLKNFQFLKFNLI